MELRKIPIKDKNIAPPKLLRIYEIFVNETGKVTGAIVSGECYSREAFINNLNNYANILEHDDTSFTLSVSQLQNIKVTDDYTYWLNTRDMKLKEIKVQITDTEDNILLIDEITLYLPDLESRVRLMRLGFKETPDANCLRADIKTLYTVMYNNSYLAQHLGNLGIRTYGDGDILVYRESYNIGQDKTNVIKLNTYIEKLNSWKNKMKLLGEYENYNIVNNIELEYYVCKTSSPILPPVVKIGRNGFKRQAGVNIEHLRIPDSVMVIDFSVASGIERIELGENTINIHKMMMYTSRIVEADLKDIITEVRFSSGWDKIETTLNTVLATGVDEIVKETFGKQRIKIKNF